MKTIPNPLIPLIPIVLALLIVRPAPGESGACCLDDGTCVVLEGDNLFAVVVDCSLQGGIYLGTDVPCKVCRNLTGACCLPDGGCAMMQITEGTPTVPDPVQLFCSGFFGGTFFRGASCIDCMSSTAPPPERYDVSVRGHWSGIPVEMSFVVDLPGTFTQAVEIEEYVGIDIATTNYRNTYPVVPESVRFRAGTWEVGLDMTALATPPAFTISHVDYGGFKFGDAWTRVSAYVSDLPFRSGDAVEWKMYAVRSAGHYSETWPTSLDLADLAGTWDACTPYFDFCEWTFLQIGGKEFDMIVEEIAITHRSSCTPDLDGSGAVDGADVRMLFAAWGDCVDCPADLDDSGGVDAADIVEAMTRWGACRRD